MTFEEKKLSSSSRLMQTPHLSNAKYTPVSENEDRKKSEWKENEKKKQIWFNQFSVKSFINGCAPLPTIHSFACNAINQYRAYRLILTSLNVYSIHSLNGMDNKSVECDAVLWLLLRTSKRMQHKYFVNRGGGRGEGAPARARKNNNCFFDGTMVANVFNDEHIARTFR